MARRTGCRARRRTLPQSLQRLPHAAVSGAVPTVVGRAPDHPLDGDPGARAGNGRARVRRGRSRHGCRCPVSVVCASVVGRGIAANQVHMCARNGTQIFRTIRSRSCGKSWSANCTRSARDDAAGCGVHRCPLRSARRVNNHGHVGCAGHHAIDVRSAHAGAPDDAANRTLRINWKLGPRNGHASPRRCSTNTSS